MTAVTGSSSPPHHCSSLERSMFPYNIEPVEDVLNKELMDNFGGEKYGFVQVGPKKWCLPAIYREHAEKFYSYPLQPDDVWVITYPRSGTTMCQELVWLVNNNFDYDTASKIALEERFPFYEFAILQTERFQKELIDLNNNDPIVNEQLQFWRRPVYEWDMPSPRHLKTHLPYSLLPPDLTEKCKSIYIARNPKDVAVSYYHHNKLIRCHDYKGDFEKYWEYFTKDLLVFSPYWEHIKEAWELRNKENVLFLFYEELNNNTADCIRKIAKFLDKAITEEDVTKLCDHLKIDNFRKAVTVHKNIPIKGAFNEYKHGFVRKGEVGGNDEFTEEMNKFAAEWINENLTKTDLIFPTKN